MKLRSSLSRSPDASGPSSGRSSGRSLGRSTSSRIALAVAAAGLVGLGLLAVPLSAGAAPTLPPVSPEELVSSVLTAKPGAFGGTVTLDNALGLPALPGVPQAANGTSAARVWSDGQGRGRVSLPTSQGEQTVVDDGATIWSWDSAGREVTKATAPKEPSAGGRELLSDPAGAAKQLLAAVRATSTVTVDGSAEVAGRAAYDLVLTPAPTERTLLREVRIAVDAEQRLPLQLTVYAQGTTDPALQVGFTDLTVGAQDPSLFTFTPPAGADVQEVMPGTGTKPPIAETKPTIVGDGWDTVLIVKLPASLGGAGSTGSPGAPDSPSQPGSTVQPSAALLNELGTPVSGSWGSGRLITTAVANAILTSDGRVAAGAVPEQVLTDALAK